jgi:integrase
MNDADMVPVGQTLHGLPSGDSAQCAERGKGNVVQFPSPSVPATRKRGKCMSRRRGQNPKVRTRERANGEKDYRFQYWIDVPGQEDRKRMQEVIGPVSRMTKSEAERYKLDFISKLEINSRGYQIPSAHTFAHAAKHYREKFGPMMHRDSTRSVWDGRLKNHLEPDWKDVPIDLITFDAVSEWAAKKRAEGLLSWTTVKDSLRTMQRVISAFTKDHRIPFSQRGLIPEREKLRMKVQSRKRVSYSWQQTEQIAEHIRKMDGLGDSRREQYATLILLAAASGLRCSELLALRVHDLDFKTNSIIVDEASDQRTSGKIGECKNDAAYRTVLLADREGRKAMQCLKQLIGDATDTAALVFRSKRGGPLLETTILRQCLHPALKALGLPKSGMHAFRSGCNRRWELAGLNPAVQRQMMGHSSASMTRLYSGEIPIEDVAAAFSRTLGVNWN